MKLNVQNVLFALAMVVLVVIVSGQDREGVNEEMLARLQANGEDEGEGGETDWQISRLKKAQAAYDGEQQHERMLQQREAAVRERYAKQQQAEESSLETRQLFQAIMSASDGDLVVLQEMLRGAGSLAGRVNRNGESPLHVACMRGQAGVVRLLLQAGADPNARTNPNAISDHDMTPLSWCVQAGHFDAAEVLLDSPKTDANMHFVVRQRQRDRGNSDSSAPTFLTAMDLAVSRGDEDMIALLDEYRAKPYEAQSKQREAEAIIADEAAFQRFLNMEVWRWVERKRGVSRLCLYPCTIYMSP